MNTTHYLLVFVTSLLVGGSRISSMNCESPLLTLMLQFSSVIPPGTRDRYSDVLHPAIALLFFDAALSGPTLLSTRQSGWCWARGGRKKEMSPTFGKHTVLMWSSKLASPFVIIPSAFCGHKYFGRFHCRSFLQSCAPYFWCTALFQVHPFTIFIPKRVWSDRWCDQ